MDGLKGADEEERQLKFALLASGRADPALVFPDIFQKELAEDDDLSDPDTEYDYSGVEFSPPTQDEDTLREFEKLQQAMFANAQIGVKDGTSAPPVLGGQMSTGGDEDREWV